MQAVEPVQYRPLRAGPEATLQRAVELRLLSLFPQENRLLWTAGSVPVGAGRPDILLTSCEPQIMALTGVDVTTRAMLAYLRAVGCARSETISARLGKTRKSVERNLSSLVEANIIIVEHGRYALSRDWRAVLPEIVTIEVKVGDWRRAVAQAARNRIFAHRSFVALPERVAVRVKAESIFREQGIGILEVATNGNVRVARRARRTMPKVWDYYYSLAFMAAEHLNGEGRGVYRPNRQRKSAVS
jgi:DNA-binding MarR family transcriptional regulator